MRGMFPTEEKDETMYDRQGLWIEQTPEQIEAERKHYEEVEREQAAMDVETEKEERKYEAAKANATAYQAAVKACNDAEGWNAKLEQAMEIEEEKFDCKYYGGGEFNLEEFLKYRNEPMPDEGGNGPGLMAQIDADHRYEAMDRW